MKKFKSFNYVSVLIYSSLFILFVAFNYAEAEVYPYSVAAFIAALSVGANVFVTPLLFVGSFLIGNNVGYLAFAGITAAFFSILFLLYKKLRFKPDFLNVAMSVIIMTVFCVLGNTQKDIPIMKRVLVSVFTTVLTLFCYISGGAVTKKGLKYKFAKEEFFTLAAVTSVLGLGICRVASPYVWKAFSYFVILLSAFVFRKGITLLISCVLGIGLALYYGDVNYISFYLIIAVVAESLTSFSRYAAALAVMACDYAVCLVFPVYGEYSVKELIFALAGVAVFTVIPTKLLNEFKDKLYSFRERQLIRQSINRNRSMVSNRLYEISGVFTEMSSAFRLFKKNGTSEDSAKTLIDRELRQTVCKNCPSFKDCREKRKPEKEDILKLIDIGFAKGKLSVIDFPASLLSGCGKVSDMIFAINKMLASYRAKILENINVNSGRELIAMQTSGISEVLRGLALETGTLIKYQSRLERSLSDALLRSGFSVSELLIYGEDKCVTVSLILTMDNFSLSAVTAVISKTLGMKMALIDKSDVTEDKCYLSFGKSPEFDAAFGICKKTKTGSDKSGDTYSVTKIDDGKFLVAVSDGMGSGKNAENISSTSLSLIESFYKAGLKSDLILNTVNKLLAINTEDDFTALDISVIDLKNCSADFIKYGSPYGFIIGEEGIKIVEGNSLPLGILEELKPSVCHAELNDGDMLLFLSDGVSDAFGSSAEIIEFLRTVPAKNPQSLADDIVKQALLKDDGIKKDDMTALAVRIYKTA